MPTGFENKVAEQSDHSKRKIMNEFKKEEETAKHKNIRNPYAYATSVVEKMNPGYKPKTTDQDRKPEGA